MAEIRNSWMIPIFSRSCLLQVPDKCLDCDRICMALGRRPIYAVLVFNIQLYFVLLVGSLIIVYVNHWELTNGRMNE